MSGVRCMVMRGGTSKGAYFLRSDLPDAEAARDELLMRIMGTPDARQIDGIGGAHPLTSKVAVVWASADRGADVDYLFLQVGVERAFVTDQQNCGNLLAGIGPFAIERGLIAPAGDRAEVRIRMVNTGGIATATFPVADGRPVYEGECEIAGVPGAAAPIELVFEPVSTPLFPTGHVVDTIDGVEVTCVDNGMPVVVMRAADVGIDGDESCDDLESDNALRERVEQLRLLAGELMRLGDVAALTVPKVALVSRPRHGGTLMTRSFIPHRCHDAVGVLAAVSIATAVFTGEGPAASVVAATPDERIVVEHPTGTLDATVVLRRGADGAFTAEKSGIVRTARKLMDGLVFPR